MTIEHTIFWIDNKPVNMRAPLSYLDASEEARAQICNGLGPAGVGGWLIPDTVYGMSMTEPSNIHDWCYEYGAREGLTQLEADKLFRTNMLAMINELPGWGWVKWLRRRRAQEYYAAVRLMGHRHYKHAISTV